MRTSVVRAAARSTSTSRVWTTCRHRSDAKIGEVVEGLVEVRNTAVLFTKVPAMPGIDSRGNRCVVRGPAFGPFVVVVRLMPSTTLDTKTLGSERAGFRRAAGASMARIVKKSEAAAPKVTALARREVVSAFLDLVMPPPWRSLPRFASGNPPVCKEGPPGRLALGVPLTVSRRYTDE